MLTPMEVKGIDHLQSRYGLTWRGFRSKQDERFGVWGGEVLVKDLHTDETLAIRRGYAYFAPYGPRNEVCPDDRTASIAYKFVSKVLIPLPDEYE